MDYLNRYLLCFSLQLISDLVDCHKSAYNKNIAMKMRFCSGYAKNKFLTIAFVLTLPLFLTACTLADVPFVGQFFGGNGGGGSGVESVGSANLTIWGLWENTDVVNAMIEKFKEQNPDVTINYDDRSVIKPLVEYKERAYSRATDETGPDIMRVHISWIPSLANSLVPMPEGMMDAETFARTFYPSATENLVRNGQIYGLPTYYDGLVLVYNKDHFEEIGQTEAPTAWEEFRRIALQLTVRGDGNNLVRGGAAIGTSSNIDFFSDIIGLLFAQAGVKVPADVDGKAAQDALSFYLNFAREDRVWSDGMPEASVAFSQGKVSMIFVPVWNLLDIVTAHPEMNIGVAPVPQASADNPAAWATYWVDVVPLSSKNPKASWAFLKFMADEEQQAQAYSESTKFRVYGAPFSRVSMASQLASNPYIAPALQTAPFATTNVLANRAGNRRHVTSLGDSISNILNSGSRFSVEEALKGLKEELSR